MNVDGNGNNPYSHAKKFPEIFFSCCRLAVDRSVLTDVVFWKMKLLSDFQSIVNVFFRIFVIQRLMSSFLWNCFYCSTVCIFLRVCGNGNNAMEMPWGKGVRLEYGNRTEWECKTPFPVISGAVHCGRHTCTLRGENDATRAARHRIRREHTFSVPHT